MTAHPPSTVCMFLHCKLRSWREVRKENKTLIPRYYPVVLPNAFLQCVYGVYIRVIQGRIRLIRDRGGIAAASRVHEG